MEVKISVFLCGLSFATKNTNGQKSAFIARAKSSQNLVFIKGGNAINVLPVESDL